MAYSWSYDGLLNENVPDIYLNEINRTAIGMLDKRFISDFSISMKIINISTVTFKYNINHRTPPSFYDEVKNSRCFEIIGFGWFVITSSELIKNEEENYIDISAESFQTVLQEKKLYNIGTITTDDSYDLYTLYHDNDTDHSLIHKVIEKNPKWTIGFIDPEIKNSYRTFNVSETSTYDLLVTTAAEAYECYFVFDFNDRKINAYKAKNIGDYTNIYISLKNVINEYGLKENRSDMATRIDVYGGDDCGNGNLNILNVNPSGTNYLMNIDYFKDRMPNEMKNKLTAYMDLCEQYRGSYTQLTTSLYALYEQLNTLNTFISTTLTDLSTYGLHQLEILHQSKNILLSTYTGNSMSSQYTACYNEIKNIETYLNNKKAQIASKETEINNTITSISNYSDLLDIKNNFTIGELRDLEDFMIDGSYTNESYVCTETMTQSERLNMQLELLEAANEYLQDVSHPKYELTLNSENFIKILGNNNKAVQFKLGNIINIDLDDNLSNKENSFLQLKLIEVSKNYTYEGVDVSFVFSSSLKLIGGEIAYDDLLGDVSSTNKYLSYNASTISRAYGIVNSTSGFLKADFNATLNKLKESDKQQFLLDSTGAKLKKLIGDNTYSPNQMWMTNNGLYLTTNAFESISCAIGEIVTSDGNVMYGIAADILIGKLIVGEKLKLSGSGAELDLSGNSIITQMNGSLEALTAEFNVGIDGLKAEFESTISNYSTTTQVNSLISASAGNIKLTVNGTQTTLDKAMSSATASIELKINKTDGGGMVSAINATADTIKLGGNKIDITGNTTFTSVQNTANSAYSTASSASSAASTAQSTINSYKTALQNGTTTINGGCIDTGSLSADFITTAARGTGWIICKNVSDNGANYICGVGQDYSGSTNLVLKTGGNVAFACGMLNYVVGESTSKYNPKVQIFHDGEIRGTKLILSGSAPEDGYITADKVSTNTAIFDVTTTRQLSVTQGLTVGSLSVTNLTVTTLMVGSYSALTSGNYSVFLDSAYSKTSHTHRTGSIQVDTVSSTGNIDFSGGVNAATPSWCNGRFALLDSSDVRLKYNIMNLENVKKIYMAFKPKSYKFKPNCAKDQKTHNGVLAQELISNLTDNGIDYEDSGFIEEYDTRNYLDESMYTSDGKAYRVNYNEFHAYHIKMIQILNDEISQLKIEIELLKERGS